MIDRGYSVIFLFELDGDLIYSTFKAVDSVAFGPTRASPRPSDKLVRGSVRVPRGWRMYSLVCFFATGVFDENGRAAGHLCHSAAPGHVAHRGHSPRVFCRDDEGSYRGCARRIMRGATRRFQSAVCALLSWLRSWAQTWVHRTWTLVKERAQLRASTTPSSGCSLFKLQTQQMLAASSTGRLEIPPIQRSSRPVAVFFFNKKQTSVCHMPVSLTPKRSLR